MRGVAPTPRGLAGLGNPRDERPAVKGLKAWTQALPGSSRVDAGWRGGQVTSVNGKMGPKDKSPKS